MKKETWKEIESLAEFISMKLKSEGNPHQEIVISQTRVRLVSDERCSPCGCSNAGKQTGGDHKHTMPDIGLRKREDNS